MTKYQITISGTPRYAFYSLYPLGAIERLDMKRSISGQLAQPLDDISIEKVQYIPKGVSTQVIIPHYGRVS